MDNHTPLMSQLALSLSGNISFECFHDKISVCSENITFTNLHWFIPICSFFNLGSVSLARKAKLKNLIKETQEKKTKNEKTTFKMCG